MKRKNEEHKGTGTNSRRNFLGNAGLVVGCSFIARKPDQGGRNIFKIPLAEFNEEKQKVRYEVNLNQTGWNTYSILPGLSMPRYGHGCLLNVRLVI